MNPNDTGALAETAALSFLNDKGLVLVERNFQIRLGEIDLIMQDEQELVFVEVRLRSNSYLGSGAESVDKHKQKKLCRTALSYLQQHQLTEKYCRFDIVSVSFNKEHTMHFDWLKNAFYASW